MRYVFIALCALWLPVTSAFAQLSINLGLPVVSIGVNVPVYPNLVPVPGYPVYYAPGMNANFFFYDGMYWVYRGDNWYASTWYNGPWGVVAPEAVPLFVLRVPVRYYRDPPPYFRGWASGGPPRWGDHWGNGWAAQHQGWDHWNHASMPHIAPLPAYQKAYSGGRYPGAEQQQAMHAQNYHYQPHEAVVQQHYQAQSAPHAQQEQKGFENVQHPGQAPAPGRPPVPQQAHSAPPGAAPHPQPAPPGAAPHPQPAQHEEKHEEHR
jgi:hypothetical protein